MMEFMKIAYGNHNWREAKKMLEEELNFFTIYPERWAQKAKCIERDGHFCYCVTGFLMDSYCSTNLSRGAALQAMCKNVPENFAPWPSIGATQNFNDAKVTTINDIYELLRDSIRSCEVAIRETRG